MFFIFFRHSVLQTCYLFTHCSNLCISFTYDIQYLLSSLLVIMLDVSLRLVGLPYIPRVFFPHITYLMGQFIYLLAELTILWERLLQLLIACLQPKTHSRNQLLRRLSFGCLFRCSPQLRLCVFNLSLPLSFEVSLLAIQLDNQRPLKGLTFSYNQLLVISVEFQQFISLILFANLL